MTIKVHAHRKQRIHSWTTLSDEQLNQILSLSHGDPRMRDVHDVVMIISSTGLRAGELRDLRWFDVDWSKRELQVVSKTSCMRTVPFGEEVLRILEARRQRGPESTLVLGASPCTVIHRVSRALAALSARIGIDRLSMQSLRLTCLKRLFNSGLSVNTIKVIVGLS